MIDFNEAVEAIIAKDARYQREAYSFLRDALEFTIKKRRKASKESPSDLSGSDLLDGFRIFALKECGPMTKTVLEYWGVETCEDIGNLVFNLVDAGVFSKTERDSIEDFRSGFDFESAFLDPFRPAPKRLSDPAVETVQSRR